MTYPVTTGGLIQPYPAGAFSPRDPIATTTPLLGLEEMAENQITLWARSGHMLICESYPDYSEPIWSGENYFASYVVQVPRHLNSSPLTAGRRYLEVFVASVSTGIELRAYSHTGAVLLATGAFTTIGGVDGYLVSVPLPQPGDTDVSTDLFGFLLSVFRAVGGPGTLDVTSVHGYLRRLTGALPESDESCRPLEFALVHPAQVAGEAAWDVNTARDLVKVNALLRASNIRPVVTKGMCHPIRLGLLETTESPSTDDYKITLSDTIVPSDIKPSLYHEWIYFPRQGVTQVRVVLSMTKEAGPDRKVVIHFDGHEGVDVTVPETSYTPKYVPGTSWRGLDTPITLPVPLSGSPLYLRVTLVTQFTRPDVYLHHVTILEDMSPVAMEA